MQLVKSYHPGTFHIAGPDWMNMYQFARAVAGVLGLDKNLVTVVPVIPNLPSKNDSPERAKQIPRADILGLDCNQTSQMLELPDFSVITGLHNMLD